MILDVGGGRNTYPKATHIIDIVPKPEDCTLEYIQMDVCAGRWNFADKQFDYIFCRDTLEDLKNPLFVCNEMMRVGKAGRIIVPSVLTECTIGIDPYPHSDKYAGYCNHKWLSFTTKNNGILFVPKTPITHIINWTKNFSHKKVFLVFDWMKSFEVRELIPMHWDEFYLPLSRYFVYDPLGIDIGQKFCDVKFKNIYEEGYVESYDHSKILIQKYKWSNFV